MAIKKPNEEQIREAAYHIWNSEGQPDGKAEEHWFRAEQTLTSAPEDKTVPAARKRTPAKPRASAKTPRSRDTAEKA